MKRLAAAMLLLLLAPAVALAGFQPSAFRMRAPVAVEGKNGYVNATISAASPFWDGARSDFGDLRLYDDQGAEVPFIFWRPQDSATEKHVAAQLLNRGYDGQRKATTATLDFGAEPPRITGLHLQVQSKGRFLRPVVIQGSQDQRDWVELNTPDYIYDIAEQGGGRVTSLRLSNPVQMRYVRVYVLDAGGEPLPILEGSGEQVAGPDPAVAEPVLRANPQHRPASGEKQSSYEIDLGRRQPVRGLKVTASSHNFSRYLSVRGSEDGKEWQRLGTPGLVYDYDLDGRRGANPWIALRECVCRYLEITSDDGDDQPLDLQVTVLGLPVHLLFAPQPGRSYWVYTGNPVAQFPSYDLSRLPVDKAKAPTVMVGAPEANLKFSDPRPWTEAHPWVLWGELLVVVAVVGTGLVVMVRRLLKNPPGPQPPAGTSP